MRNIPEDNEQYPLQPVTPETVGVLLAATRERVAELPHLTSGHAYSVLTSPTQHELSPARILAYSSVNRRVSLRQEIARITLVAPTAVRYEPHLVRTDAETATHYSFYTQDAGTRLVKTFEPSWPFGVRYPGIQHATDTLIYNGAYRRQAAGTAADTSAELGIVVGEVEAQDLLLLLQNANSDASHQHNLPGDTCKAWCARFGGWLLNKLRVCRP